MGNVKTFKNGLKLEPVDANPSNPAQGQLQYASASHSTLSEGLYRYDGTDWKKAGGGVGSMTYIKTLRANDDGATEFDLFSEDHTVPDFNITTGTDFSANEGSLTIPSTGDGALYSELNDHKVFKFAAESASQYSAVGFEFEIPKHARGKDVGTSFFYRTDQTEDIVLSGTYQWTVSASGTSEYYLEANGGGDPSISDPNRLLENSALMTEGTLGSLAAGEWGYGDNDTLGYSTIYVRLTDSVDPDTKADGYVEAAFDTDGEWMVWAFDKTNGVKVTCNNASNEAAGQTVLTLDDNTSLSVGDKIWIACDGGAHETHVTDVDGGGADITIADALPSQWSDDAIAYTGVLTDVLSTLDAAPSDVNKKGEKYQITFRTQETTAAVVFMFQQLTSETEAELDFDGLVFDSSPFAKLSTQGMSEDYLSNSHAGYGSTNTKIPYFTNEVKNTGSKVFTVSNNSTNGLEITMLQAATVSGHFSHG